MESDWKKILKFSQKELKQDEKEKLCESLSWLEADDIELNFTDLKTLFRLAQDILKYKTEQVNSIMGKLEKSKRKVKTKERSTFTDSPAMSSDSIFETIAHQEEVIKANKDILEQLYADIAELEQRKTLYEEERNREQESESSRGTLSELNAVAQLENEVSKRNRHIKKLLGDVKILEEENTTLKEKLSIFKEKLKEATLLIENLTEQLFAFNSEHKSLKELLAKMEEEKSNLIIKTETLKSDINKNNVVNEKAEEDVKTKLQYFKDLLKSHKIKIDQLTTENTQLKEDLIQKPKLDVSPKKIKLEDIRTRELQDKLTEASEEMVKSANLIKMLRDENTRLKVIIEDIPDNSLSEAKNESDDGKEKHIINKLKRKVKHLSVALQGAEEMVTVREKELTEITAQLKLLRSDEGVNALIEGIKNKKKHLKIKDEGIKSLVQEVNALNNVVSELQLENATMRKHLQVPVDTKIPTHGILKKYENLMSTNAKLTKKLQNYENKLISLEIDFNDKCSELQQLKSVVKTAETGLLNERNYDKIASSSIQTIIEENEGLRKGLTEILSFIKDNSNTTSGILSMECPSLERILNSMDARKLAGWFSPHMKTEMELKAAIGGKDALMNALHESRKETYQVMKKLSEEEQKSSELAKVIIDIKEKTKIKTDDKVSSTADVGIGEFGSWMSNNSYGKIDFNEDSQIKDILTKGNILFENHFIQALQYFQNKFTILFDKLTSLTIIAEDDYNKWLIKEEHYKAEIESLKCRLDEDEDDSNLSPGLLSTSNKFNFMDRKYNFLEDSFKQIRTLNENIRNEHLESKKERMIESFEYEKKVQDLIISILNLTDQLRHSVPLELFLKQNEAFNQFVFKYRCIVEINNTKHIQAQDLLKRLDEDKLDIINHFHRDIQESTSNERQQPSKILSNVEKVILQKQLEQVGLELKNKIGEIELLEKKVLDMQNSQSQLIDKTLCIETIEETNSLKDQVEVLKEENKFLKDQQKHNQNKHDTLYLQLKAYEQKESNNDIELNMLRHQILDLQSVGDNKTIISRLSGEVLLAQVQTSESYEKIETFKIALQKEKQLRAETEEMLINRQKIFDIYSKRCNKRFRSMNDILEVLRHQYTGSLPLIAAETFYSRFDEIQRKSQEINEKFNEIEDLRSNLMTKHSIYSQILNLSNSKCFDDEDNCPHKIQNMILEKTKVLEFDNNNKKFLSVEQSYKKLLERCDVLERTLVLVNQGFKNVTTKYEHPIIQNEKGDEEVKGVETKDGISNNGSLTYTLQQHKPKESHVMNSRTQVGKSCTIIPNKCSLQPKNSENRQTQTQVRPTDVKLIQTDEDKNILELNSHINKLLSDNQKKDKLLDEINIINHRQAQDLLLLSTEKNDFNNKLQILSHTIHEKEELNRNLQTINDSLRKEINIFKLNQVTQINANDAVNAENQTLLENLKQIESDKNNVIIQYKELLKKERQEYSTSIKKLQLKLTDLQTEIDERHSKAISPSDDIIKETTSKYTLKISDLEDKCFKLQSNLEGYQADLKNQNSELERWKGLATERLTKMEQLSAQLKERHNHEVESYKAENQHWLSQLNDTQREHMELRSRLTEQKAFHVKQLAEKDAHIDQLRSIVNNLKTQILNMQTMLTINDPSFDLSAIVEVDEVSDAASQQGSDRLELKFESTIDLNEVQDDIARIPSNSTAIWQEPLIDRLRREKQLLGKQNAILRRQIKVLAARERRSRLDAQNLKNQVFRISTSGNKVPSAESAALQNKIASLQAQLTSARRDVHSSVALWDKWKRAQQSAERWQAKYEEKCQEVKKLEVSLNLARSAVTRLEKEKRVLLTRLGDVKNEKSLAIEKQDAEASEKVLHTSRSETCYSPPPVSTRALLDRVEAQQRRIAALELAEKGNETLISEYEKCLAEITSLKGQVLKLESTLLEAQIRSPLKSPSDTKPELEYWKNYCDMLKEENMQLTLRISSVENVPTSANHQRISDLEQTVLTLRGLVSKLQAEQKTTSVPKRIDTRPSSGRNGSEKLRSQVESYRIEISNLKKSILEKDALLESSKEMLKIAAEREDELLKENILLQRHLEQLAESKRGFMSA